MRKDHCYRCGPDAPHYSRRRCMACWTVGGALRAAVRRDMPPTDTEAGRSFGFLVEAVERGHRGFMGYCPAHDFTEHRTGDGRCWLCIAGKPPRLFIA